MPARAINTYQKTRMQTISGREIEASVLEQASTKLRRAQQNLDKVKGFNKELDEAIQFNNKIWKILQADWQSKDNKLPKQLRQDLLSLSVFIRKTSLAIMAHPEAERIEILIQINDNLTKGLRSKETKNTPNNGNDAGQGLQIQA